MTDLKELLERVEKAQTDTMYSNYGLLLLVLECQAALLRAMLAQQEKDRA